MHSPVTGKPGVNTVEAPVAVRNDLLTLTQPFTVNGHVSRRYAHQNFAPETVIRKVSSDGRLSRL